MTIIIDRRKNPKNKSLINRQRFIKRVKEHVQKSIKDSIQKRSVSDTISGEKIKIPVKGINEPSFRHSRYGGKRQYVLPGNQEYIEGDIIQKPTNDGQGDGDQEASSDPNTSQDEFEFSLTKEEFFQFFFDDLELLDLVKKQLSVIEKPKLKRSGYTTVGNPSNLNIVESAKKSLARRIATKNPLIKKLALLEKQFQQIEDQEQKNKLLEEIDQLKKKIKKIPWMDPIDLKYNLHLPHPQPMTKAVMFCVMDVSGSMDESKKDLAKRFFMLLYLFLSTKYEKIDLIFVRHHTTAEEVSEQDFFYSRESGGTIISSGLALTSDIIKKRYPINEWNIYVCQATDGENWSSDNDEVKRILQTELLPIVQYFAYIEILSNQYAGNFGYLSYGDLWTLYTNLTKSHNNLCAEKIGKPSDIYKVFKSLFSKEESPNE